MVRALWSLHLLLLPGTRTKELEEVSQAVSSHSGSGHPSLHPDVGQAPWEVPLTV